MGLLRRLLPVSRLGAALWAWRNRRELARWVGFAGGAGGRLRNGSREDLVTEARLRARLTGDPRTRGVRDLSVRVTDGVAVLRGTIPRAAHLAAVSLADSTKGVRRVDCRLQDRGSRIAAVRAGAASRDRSRPASRAE